MPKKRLQQNLNVCGKICEIFKKHLRAASSVRNIGYVLGESVLNDGLGKHLCIDNSLTYVDWQSILKNIKYLLKIDCGFAQGSIS